MFGNIVAIISLFVSLAALIIAREQKLLELASNTSHALLFSSIILPTKNPSECSLKVSFEVRGPIPYYDLRLCVWGKESRAIQIGDSQREVISSAEGPQEIEVLIPSSYVGNGYFGFVWSEPHRRELITLGRRSPLQNTFMTRGTEYWKWTPLVEKLSFGFFSGGWKTVRSDRWMLLKRENGPTM